MPSLTAIISGIGRKIPKKQKVEKKPIIPDGLPNLIYTSIPIKNASYNEGVFEGKVKGVCTDYDFVLKAFKRYDFLLNDITSENPPGIVIVDIADKLASDGVVFGDYLSSEEYNALGVSAKSLVKELSSIAKDAIVMIHSKDFIRSNSPAYNIIRNQRAWDNSSRANLDLNVYHEFVDQLNELNDANNKVVFFCDSISYDRKSPHFFMSNIENILDKNVRRS